MSDALVTARIRGFRVELKPVTAVEGLEDFISSLRASVLPVAAIVNIYFRDQDKDDRLVSCGE